MTSPAPPIALTMGDPAGIGPELSLKAWSELQATGPVFFIIADTERMEMLAREMGFPVQSITHPAAAGDVFADALPVLPVTLNEAATPGTPNRKNAPVIIESIERAVRFALAGQVSSVVTNPISKAILYSEDFKHAGHTEFVADLSTDYPLPGERGPIMMLASPLLRVSLVTIHAPLKDAIASLSVESIVRTARVTAQALQRDFGIAKPRLAIAGLNPHAGEAGSIGREEIDIIEPAAAALRDEGFDVMGPLPPDAMFHTEARAKYDAAICLYHDQGLIPLKALDFWGGVNVTLGLPLIRTSPDHGTAFDLAGKGIARADSLIAAIRMAGEMAARRAA